jgi:preprotein translocase subunit SecD
LTVGMAVDANVLIFSRIREELAQGASNQGAISAGYDRAFVSILDANITTLIVALILFLIGSGPVQGFAVTLSIGILTSMFTSIVMTRGLVNMVIGGRKIDKLWI